MKVLGIVLLAVGYPVALVVLVRLLPVLTQRRRARFVALESAMACLVAGWLVLGEPIGSIVNGTALVGFAVAWIWTARHHR